MPICAYCGSSGRMTHEHLFPACIHERTRHYDMSYLYRMKDVDDPEAAIKPTEHRIKDVCGDCNNRGLSSLDMYVCQLYDRYFERFVRTGQEIDFEYEHDLLARWLLKVSYNSARVHSSADLDALAQCAGYILHGTPKPQGLVVYARLVVPAVMSARQRAAMSPEELAKLDRDRPPEFQGTSLVPPAFLRNSRADHPSYTGRYAVCRQTGINSYYLYTLLPLGDSYSRPDWRRELKLFETSEQGIQRLPQDRRRMTLRASRVHALDVVVRFLQNNEDEVRASYARRMTSTSNE